MNDMYLLVWASARATSVAVMWAHALRATAGEIFLLSTITNLCVVWPPCGSVRAVPLYESNEPARRVFWAFAAHDRCRVAMNAAMSRPRVLVPRPARSASFGRHGPGADVIPALGPFQRRLALGGEHVQRIPDRRQGHPHPRRHAHDHDQPERDGERPPVSVLRCYQPPAEPITGDGEGVPRAAHRVSPRGRPGITARLRDAALRITATRPRRR